MNKFFKEEMVDEKKCIICGKAEGELHKIFEEKDAHICSDCLSKISDFIREHTVK